jgi:acyl-CoA thioester hydrolase
MKIPQTIDIQIRFSDCDLMGHVNNACYLNYFELARMHYLTQLLPSDWNWSKQGIILKKNEVEYIKPLYLNDKASILVYTESVGTKSFTLAYELLVNNEIRTKGKSLIVCFDFIKKETVEIYNELQTALTIIKKHK